MKVSAAELQTNGRTSNHPEDLRPPSRCSLHVLCTPFNVSAVREDRCLSSGRRHAFSLELCFAPSLLSHNPPGRWSSLNNICCRSQNLDDETSGALNGGAPPGLDDSAKYDNELKDADGHHGNDLVSTNHEPPAANISRGESFVSSAMYV